MANDNIVVGLEIDSSNANKQLDATEKKAISLEKSFQAIGKASAIAFGAAAGVIGVAIKQYADGERATTKLNQALVTQGVYTRKLAAEYTNYANELSRVTLFGDEEFTNAQAIIQAYAGKTKVTKDLLKATADLAQVQGIDLATAAQVVGKAIDGSTEILGRSGLEISKVTGSSARMASVIETVGNKFKGQSEAAAQGVGWFSQFGKASGDLAKAIGAVLAPAAIKAAQFLTNLTNAVADNKELVKFAAGALAVVAGVAALAGSVSGAVLMFIKLKAALTVVAGIIGGISLPMVAIVGAIALLATAIGVFAVNWKQNWANIGEVARAAGEIIKGAFTLDPKQISKGYDDLKAAVSKTATELVNNPQLEELKTKISSAFSGGSSEERAANNAALLEERAVQNAAQLEQSQGYQDEEGRILLISSENRKKLSKAEFEARLKDQQTFFSTAATLQSSKSKELAAIGKAAAILQVAIATPPAIASSFKFGASIGGPVLGAAFAGIAGVAMAAQAAAIAGVKVAKGGLITTGNSSYDNVPAILERGEFVAPKESADDIINARARELAGVGGGTTEVIISMKDDIMKFFETKILERRALGVSAI